MEVLSVSEWKKVLPGMWHGAFDHCFDDSLMSSTDVLEECIKRYRPSLVASDISSLVLMLYSIDIYDPLSPTGASKLALSLKSAQDIDPKVPEHYVVRSYMGNTGGTVVDIVSAAVEDWRCEKHV